MKLLKIKTEEAGKVISLVASTWQVITTMNITEVNNDQSSFDYNAETGEISILRNGVYEFDGQITLENTDDETPLVNIAIYVDGIFQFMCHSAVSWTKVFSSNSIPVLQGQVITLKIMSPETIDVQTTADQHWLRIKRLYL